jgi:asparagine synthase (glutamine-hydrolysing)
MRVAGIYANSGEAVSRLLDALQTAPMNAPGAGLRTLTYPPHNPRVAVVLQEAVQPKVQWATAPDGSFLVMDGEVYSGPGYDAANSGNAPIGADWLLALYHSSGQAAFAQLDAAACVIVWDAARELLLVYRDRWGAVPVFYARLPDAVLFATEVGTLLRAGVSGEVNLPALDFFLGNGFVPSPWSLAEKVHKIPPAHVLHCGGPRAAQLERYWCPTGKPKIRLDGGDVVTQLSDLFARSLSRRCARAGPNGVLLSGGVDSKLIVAGLNRLLGVPVETYTFRYTDYQGEFNELDEARKTAGHFGATHREIPFAPGDISDNLEWMVQSYGEPFTYGLHSAMLGRAADSGIGALLNGAGPDGWYLNRYNVYGVYYGRVPGMLRALGDAAIPLVRRLNSFARPAWLWRLYAKAGVFADTAETVAWCARTGLPIGLSGVITPELYRPLFYQDKTWLPAARSATQELFNEALADYRGESARDKITLVHRQFKNPEGTLYWNHWWGRAHGLTVRFPYFDAELMDFVMRLPRKSRDKAEVRELAAQLMPRELAYTRKLPQTVPIRYWFQGPLRDFLCDQLSPARLQHCGLFDTQVVQNCISQHLKGKNDHAWKLWAILTVVVWHDLVSRGEL